MQVLKFKICGSIARCTSGNIVNDENGVLSVEFDETVNGKLSYRINNKPSHTVRVTDGKATIPTNTLAAGVLRGELYTDNKIIIEAIEIRSYFDENVNRFTANAQANDILERLCEAEKQIAELKETYSEQYAQVLAQLNEQTELLKKINKSYTLGLFGGQNEN